MFVKICGITRAADAEIAVACGAGAVGFIFWPKSARYVDPEKARAIVKTLPPFVVPVGVFVNERVDLVNSVADRAGLGAVQLHGDEEPDAIAMLNRPVVKAVGRHGVEAATKWPATVMLLVDADDRQRRGGTGMRADWESAARLSTSRRILLAGGLTAENVAGAIAAVRPFGIDVSSGVESSPGVKDPARMRALFEAVRSAERAGVRGGESQVSVRDGDDRPSPR